MKRHHATAGVDDEKGRRRPHLPEVASDPPSKSAPRARYRKLQTQLDVCLANPEDALFLDIETTGLSHHYDDITVIGWAIGGSAYTTVRGGDISSLRNAASRAAALVTFNGIRFDTKFIARDYPDIVLPDIHVDLMYLCRRVGLRGGQKRIERELEISMREDIDDIDGAAAVALWHEYVRGNENALRRLIAYNRADIAAMGAIFDEALSRLEVQLSLFSNDVRFAKWSAPSNWKELPAISAPSGALRKDRSTYADLFGEQDTSKLRVVGIDLTGSEKRASGWSLLEGPRCSVETLKSDEEIIDRTVLERPDLVSIDSPLCLPSGRISVRDDDPGRKQFGIMRQCERELKRRGINVYPCLIQSMQNLTERGIRLASELRGHGVPVIESYPGAAQDIMRIPRKSAGLDWLRLGLSEFGILGDEVIAKATHDELDAITSALVGVFHWVGMSEELGTEDEEPLILPSKRRCRTANVVGISGPIAAGKTTMARMLERCGFEYTRFSLVIDDILRERKISPCRRARQALGNELNASGRQRWLCRKTVERAEPAEFIVVDGLRFPEDRAWLAENFGAGFLHVHVDAVWEVRRMRYQQAEYGVEFREASDAPVERSVGTVMELAHEKYVNHGTRAELKEYVERGLGDRSVDI